ncbi:MAG: hypothetical protein M3248_07530, partial [Actinomycetota bacterium]|nr:hypothetical protein [Actinomycetota bacterium]
VKGSSRQSIAMDCSWTNRLPTPRERHAPFVAVVRHIPGTASPSVPREAGHISAQVAVVKP